MIICRNCGKIKTYKIRQTIAREIIHSEGGMTQDIKVISTGNGEPRCPKCGRLVKFFKDEEREDEE